MTRTEKLFEITRNDIEVCKKYCEIMGSDELTEKARKRIDYLWAMHYAANLAPTMDIFWKNLEQEMRNRELNESDFVKIKFYVEKQLDKEDNLDD